MVGQGGNAEQINMKSVYYITGVAALGGLLFGYDTAVISGAIGFLQTKFELDATMKGWAASSAIIGCIFGAMSAGWTSDRWGRKKVLIMTAVLFGISAIGSAIPRNLTEFVIARFIGGLGVGAASMLSPLYITELAPASIRGRLVSLYQLAIVLGINLIFFVNWLVQELGDEAWNTEMGWRYMLGSETLPALLFFTAMFFVPESPRWLVKEGRDDEALGILTDIDGPDKAKSILADIKEALLEEKGTLKELLSGRFRKAVVVGIVLAVFSQFQGINAIMYYAPEIFKEVGIPTHLAFLQTVIIGVINTIFTFISILFVDKVGRKALLLGGGAGMGVSLLIVGLCFKFGWTGIPLLIFIMCYTGSFAASFGPVTWVVISEIFPLKMRGIAMSVATFALWVAVYFVTQLFPIALEKLGPANTFFAFFSMSVLAFLFVLVKVPETKEKTLEEIEHHWH